MLPDAEALFQHERTRTPLLTLETGTPTSDFDVLAISHAYELEGTGIVTLLRLSGVNRSPSIGRRVILWLCSADPSPFESASLRTVRRRRGPGEAKPVSMRFSVGSKPT